jgi:hypothetical protein
MFLLNVSELSRTTRPYIPDDSFLYVSTFSAFLFVRLNLIGLDWIRLGCQQPSSFTVTSHISAPVYGLSPLAELQTVAVGWITFFCALISILKVIRAVEPVILWLNSKLLFSNCLWLKIILCVLRWAYTSTCNLNFDWYIYIYILWRARCGHSSRRCLATHTHETMAAATMGEQQFSLWSGPAQQ